MQESEFKFGVDYYPEQWPEDRWPIDARLMKEAGFNVVRLAEFAWTKMEPTEGKFDFDWLDRAIGILHSQGLKVVLGTPTASPPAWLMSRSPELFRMTIDGVRMSYGGRREICPNHATYHDHTRRIVCTMADHYSAHPAVIGWQIDNEFGEPCYCPACAQAFHTWLQHRYASLQELNSRWGTAFWSHIYTDWCEIPVPGRLCSPPNPGLGLDFARFSSDAYVAYQRMQIELIRERCPHHFITHNFMGFDYESINYFDLARDLDLVGWDNYPRTLWAMEAEPDPSRMALSHAAMRGLKGKNFWVIEQQAGQAGWDLLGVAPRPGELRLWAYQSIAHGADGVVFFRWRTARFGTEQLWKGLLDADAHPGRRYEEIKGMGAELQKMGSSIAGSVVKSPVAMVLSYDSRFAFQIQPNHARFRYGEHFRTIYRSFYRRQIPVDILSPDADVSNYQVVVLPAMYLVPEGLAQKLAEFVRSGGILLVTQRSGVKDECNAVVDQCLPGPLAELCGMGVVECDSLSEGMENRLTFVSPELGEAQPSVGVLCEILKPTGAEVLARYTGDFYAGEPAITTHRVGRGQAVYVGSLGTAELYEPLVGWILKQAGIESLLEVPEGFEVTQRWHGQQRLLFILNHSNQEQQIHLKQTCLDLLRGCQAIQGDVPVRPKEVIILASPPDDQG
jgi:beta-galactosidase